MRNVKPLGMSFSTFKYQDIDAVERSAKRAEWNEPVLWPLAVLAVLIVAILLPAIVTMRRRARATGILLGGPVSGDGDRRSA